MMPTAGNTLPRGRIHVPHKKEKRKENPFKMQNIFIVAAKRTPFGSFGGSLKHLTATDLATVATKAALEAGNVDPSVVDSVFVGNVIQSSADAAYLARHVGLVSLLDTYSTTDI